MLGCGVLVTVEVITACSLVYVAVLLVLGCECSCDHDGYGRLCSYDYMALRWVFGFVCIILWLYMVLCAIVCLGVVTLCVYPCCLP